VSCASERSTWVTALAACETARLRGGVAVSSTTMWVVGCQGLRGVDGLAALGRDMRRCGVEDNDAASRIVLLVVRKDNTCKCILGHIILPSCVFQCRVQCRLVDKSFRSGKEHEWRYLNTGEKKVTQSRTSCCRTYRTFRSLESVLIF
jgi:hypothetical protein